MNRTDEAARQAGTPAGPFETEREVRELPAVRAVYEAFDADPGAGRMAPHTRRLLGQALRVAGVDMGQQDERVAEWLARWEPQTVAVIAGWITRASQAGDTRTGTRQ